MHTLFLLSFFAIMQPFSSYGGGFVKKMPDDFTFFSQQYNTIDACDVAGNELSKRYVDFENSLDITKVDDDNSKKSSWSKLDSVISYAPKISFKCKQIQD